MSHMGHQRRFEHAPGTSTLPPIPDVLLSRSKGAGGFIRANDTIMVRLSGSPPLGHQRPGKQTEYKRLGTIISDARLAGMVDWGMVEDRARHLRDISKWDSPVEIIEAVAQQYREDIWRTQRWRPEVWIEKDALSGVIERPCHDLRVPYFCLSRLQFAERAIRGRPTLPPLARRRAGANRVSPRRPRPERARHDPRQQRPLDHVRPLRRAHRATGVEHGPG